MCKELFNTSQAHSIQVSLQDTRYYRLISRSVHHTNLCCLRCSHQENYEHRRQWMLDQIRFLNIIFAIYVTAYAVMFYYSHLIEYVDESEANIVSKSKLSN